MSKTVQVIAACMGTIKWVGLGEKGNRKIMGLPIREATRIERAHERQCMLCRRLAEENRGEETKWIDRKEILDHPCKKFKPMQIRQET
jgi:hypothetical protein